MIKQTGLIPCYPHPEDYITGGETAIKPVSRVINADWTAYLPSVEKQYGIGFDTLSCTSFSLCSIAETNVNYLIRSRTLPESSIQWLKDNGYIDDMGHVNFSDRFLAIMSGTTERGNDFRTVVETARKVGFIPDKDLPFGGNSFKEYHEKTMVTEQMKAKGKEFLKHISIAWEWVFFDQDPNLSGENFNAVNKAITQAPLQIGIPTPANHATMMYAIDDKKFIKVFDTYDPYFFSNTADAYMIHFAMKVVLSPQEVKKEVVYPTFVFTKTLKFGMKNSDVKMLQQVLIAEGLLKQGLDTGNFFDKTLQALKNFQVKYGIEPVGQVGPKTRTKLNELCSKKA